MFVLALFFATNVLAQRIAVIVPDRDDDTKFAERLAEQIGQVATFLDGSMSNVAFNASKHIDPFNMTADEAKNAGAAIGCDFFILVRTGIERRASIKPPDYFEAYAAMYLVSSRSGRLVHWSIPSFKEETEIEAWKKLTDAATQIAKDLIAAAKFEQKRERTDPKKTVVEELPVENSPEAKGFRSPIPYRRIKPEYTPTAFLYGVTATVEMEVDLDAAGNILRTDVVRWAGYGLDDAVEKAVRAMSWRPAERNGKQLPIRVLLRYNFKKIEPKL